MSGPDTPLVDAILDRERRRDAEIQSLKAEIRYLKAPPRLNIIHHGDDDPYPRMTQMLVEWLGYRHRTMVDGHVFKHEGQYREFAFRAAVRAVVEAHVEALLPSLVETEETYSEHYRRVRS